MCFWREEGEAGGGRGEVAFSWNNLRQQIFFIFKGEFLLNFGVFQVFFFIWQGRGQLLLLQHIVFFINRNLLIHTDTHPNVLINTCTILHARQRYITIKAQCAGLHVHIQSSTHVDNARQVHNPTHMQDAAHVHSPSHVYSSINVHSLTHVHRPTHVHGPTTCTVLHTCTTLHTCTMGDGVGHQNLNY
jgi:hypothetical protein